MCDALSSWICNGSVAAFIRDQANAQLTKKPAITCGGWRDLCAYIGNIKPMNFIITYADVSRLYERAVLLPCSLS